MICRFCNLEKELKESHIIPRSYYKNLKREGGQLISVVCDDITIPEKANSDPKEKLLCGDCEQFLDKEYEKYGTRLFKSSNGIRQAKDYVELNGFRYVDYYLYLISILCRASISSLPEYRNIKLGLDFETNLIECIKKKSIKLGTSLKLDHFIKISVLRIVDSSGNIDDSIIKSFLLNFNVEFGKTVNDGMVYYFMVNGFLINYFLKREDDIHALRTSRINGQLQNRSQIRIPKVEVINIKQINDALNSVIKKSKRSIF
jgi:hypothetical protein